MRKKLFPLLFGLITAVLLSLVLDRALGWMGFPADSTQIAHPANFTETRQNLDFTYTFQTNSQGIRYREIPLEKPAGTQRIIVLGDSFAEGWGVEADQTFPARLESEFSTPDAPVEFINCGLSGTAPLQYARIFFEVCINYQPDAVLIALYPNDVVGTPIGATPAQIDNYRIEKTGFAKILHTLWPRTYTIIDSMLNKPAVSTDIIADVTEEARASGHSEEQISAWADSLSPELVDAANTGEFNGYILSRGLLQPNHWIQSLDLDTPEAERRFQAMLAILDEFIRRSQAQGIAVGIILLPSPFQHNPTYGDVWRQSGTIIRSEWLTEPTALEYRMSEWADENSVPYLDLTPYFRLTSQTTPDVPLNYPLDGHWTAEGNRVASEEIARWLNTWSFQ